MQQAQRMRVGALQNIFVAICSIVTGCAVSVVTAAVRDGMTL
jgi:hypothetical protein